MNRTKSLCLIGGIMVMALLLSIGVFLLPAGPVTKGWRPAQPPGPVRVQATTTPGTPAVNSAVPGAVEGPVPDVSGQAPASALSGPPAETGPIGGAGGFLLTGADGLDDVLPANYTCDGSGSSPGLSWSGAPARTKEFALMMTTLPGDGTTKWNWVLYGIPGNVTGLAKNSTGVGTLGTGSHGTVRQYDPPCSQGPGPKVYTFTLYALSGSPELPAREQVTGPALTNAISSITLGRASLSVSYSRP